MLGVVGAVIGVLLVASALGNASRDDAPATGSPLPTAAAAPSTFSPALPGASVTSPTRADDAVDERVATVYRSTAQARPPAAAISEPVTRAPAATSKPEPRAVQAAPKPVPAAEPKSEPDGDGVACE